MSSPVGLIRSRPTARHVGGRPSGSARSSSGRALLPMAIATTALTYALVLLGSTVRVTESGMGCPGWPLCDGQIGPIDRFHALLEQVHRYVASGVTVAVVAVAFLAWRSLAGRRVLKPALASVGIVAVQIALGAITVVTHNSPPTVALHLVGALALLAATTLTAVAAGAPAGAGGKAAGASTGRRWLNVLSGSALAVTFVLLVSGSLVVDGGASAACPSWPWCSPTARVASALVVIQLVHRSLAAVAALLLAALAVRTIARRRAEPRGVGFAWALVLLLPAQIAAGATSAVLRAPPAAQDVHLGIAAAIWVCTVALVATCGHPVSERRRDAKPEGPRERPASP